MYSFRTHIISRILALFIGFVFLNLSFIQTEVSIFRLPQASSAFYENLAKLIAGIGFEEEKDFAKEANEKPPVEKEIDFIHQFENSLEINEHLIISLLFSLNLIQKLRNPHREVITPPPKLA